MARQKIGDLCVGHDNHFNLIRIIAASCVIVSHAYPLALAGTATDPLSNLVPGYNLGRFAVCTFFIISGFFVFQSFERGRGAVDYIAARFLRIYPAYAVLLVITAFVIGPLFTVFSFEEYFGNYDALDYVVHNLFFDRIRQVLHGLFANTPNHMVNGSLYTLYYEVWCYGILLVVGMLAARRKYYFGLFLWLCFCTYIYAYALSLAGLLAAHNSRFPHFMELVLPFVCGMAIFRYRHKIYHSPVIFAVCICLLVMAYHSLFYVPLFILLWSYIVMYVGFYPSRILRFYNRLGDYSYGTYLYGWPVQQMCIQLIPGISPLKLMAVSLPCAWLCGVLSWHIIEKPAIRLRHKMASYLSSRHRKYLSLSQ